MPNGTYGGVRGRKTKVGEKLLRFPPTRFGFIPEDGTENNALHRFDNICGAMSG